MSWAVVEGPDGWRWLLVLVCVLVCLVAAGAWALMIALRDADFCLLFGALAALALVISIPIGVKLGARSPRFSVSTDAWSAFVAHAHGNGA